MCVCMYVCVCVRDRKCLCVCERERQSGEREDEVRVCVCVCERERERERRERSLFSRTVFVQTSMQVARQTDWGDIQTRQAIRKLSCVYHDKLTVITLWCAVSAQMPFVFVNFNDLLDTS